MKRLLLSLPLALLACALLWRTAPAHHAAAQVAQPPDWDVSFSDRSPQLLNQYNLILCSAPIQIVSFGGQPDLVCSSGVTGIVARRGWLLSGLSVDLDQPQAAAGAFVGHDDFAHPGDSTVTGSITGSAVHLVARLPTYNDPNSTFPVDHTLTLDGSIFPIAVDPAHPHQVAFPPNGYAYFGVFNDVLLGQAAGTGTTETGDTFTWSWHGALSGILPTRAQLSFAPSPQGAPAGSVLPPVHVALTGRNGQLQTAFNDRIRLTLGPGSPAGATLDGTTTVRLVNGIATFSNVKLNRPGQGYTLVASDPDFPALPSATSQPFDVSVPQQTLVFTTQPQTEHLGSPMPEVDVAVQNSPGSTDSSATGIVSLTVISTGAGGALEGTVSQPLNGGVARFTDLQVSAAGNGFSLVAFDSDTSVANGTSAPFNVVTWKLVFLPPQVQQGNLGQPLPPVQVQVQDSNGTPLVGATALVHLALQINPGGATLGGAQAAAGVQPDPVTAIATFTDLTLNKSGQGYTLKATDEDPNVTTATSNPFNVGALKLVFTGEPPSKPIALGDPAFGGLGTVQVTVEDANGNPVAGATALVHVALQNNPVNAPLRGTLAVPPDPTTGIATFTDLAIHQSGRDFTLLATDDDPSVSSATSTPFTITPYHLGFINLPSSVGAGQAFKAEVDILLSNGQIVNNLLDPNVATSLITLQLAPNTNGATLDGQGTAGGQISLNAVNGQLKLDGLTIDKPGTYQLAASDDLALTATSGPITVGTTLSVTDNDTAAVYSPGDTNTGGFTVLPGSTTTFVNAAPPPVQVGDGLQIKGGGWDPNGGPVQLRFDGEEGPTTIPSGPGAQTIAVAPDGTFTVALKTPSEHRAAWTLSTPNGSGQQPACTANVTATQGSTRADILLTGSASYYVANVGVISDPTAPNGAIANLAVRAVAEQVVSVDGAVVAGISLQHSGGVPVLQLQSGVQYLCAGEVDGTNGVQVGANAFLATYFKVPHSNTQGFTVPVDPGTGKPSYKNAKLTIGWWDESGQLLDGTMGITIKGLPILTGAYTCAALSGGRFVTMGQVGTDSNGNGLFGAAGPIGAGCITNPGPPPPKLDSSSFKSGQMLSGTQTALTLSGTGYAAGDLTITGGLTLNGILFVEGNLKVSGGLSGTGSIRANGKVEIAGAVNLTTDDVQAVQAVGGTYLYGTSAVGSQTTLTASLQPGTSEVPVASNAAFFVGDLVAINHGQPNEEDRTVTGFGSLKLDKPLLLPHAAGEPIVPLLTATPDTTPPHATATASAQPNAAGWYTAPLSVTLAAQDNAGGSGVLATYYSLDNAACTPTHLSACTIYGGTPIGLNSDGRHTLSYFSADRAGNLEAVHTLSINLDQTPPATTATQAGSGCLQQVTLTATDATSGVAGIEVQLGKGSWQAYTSPLQLLAGQQLQYRAHDVAGNVEAAHRFSFPPPAGKRCPSPFG